MNKPGARGLLASCELFEGATAVSSARDVLTPDALAMLQTIAQAGYLAAAARVALLTPQRGV